MKILPLRNLVLVRFEQEEDESPLVVIRAAKAIRPAKVLAIGPEVREIRVGMVALVNSVAGTLIGEQLLIPESAIVGTL